MPAIYQETGQPVRAGHRAPSLRWLAGLMLLALAAIVAALAIHLVSGRF